MAFFKQAVFQICWS